MDGFADQMIARGPTLAADGDTPTGSLHILDLPDPAAARAFAFDEPGYQAGVYREVLLRRWRNVLGRTHVGLPGWPRGWSPLPRHRARHRRGRRPRAAAAREELIAYGPLLSDDGANWLGTAALLRAPDPDSARAVLTAGRVRRDRGAQLAVRRAPARTALVVTAGSSSGVPHPGHAPRANSVCGALAVVRRRDAPAPARHRRVLGHAVRRPAGSCASRAGCPTRRSPMIAARNSGSAGSPASSAARLIVEANRCRCSGVMFRSRWWASIAS